MQVAGLSHILSHLILSPARLLMPYAGLFMQIPESPRVTTQSLIPLIECHYV